ncbi:MAG: MFS transporter [Actinomycetia bacterium]|nr:MFS transporter [Actinomycetes bacterium]
MTTNGITAGGAVGRSDAPAPASQDTPVTTPAPERTPQRSGVFRSLRVRNYRLYASGQLISQTGAWMQRVAQDWLVLNLTHNSGIALGLVTALQFGPFLVFGLWGGVLADRMDKRRLLFATQTGLALMALTLGVLDVTGVVRYWHVLTMAALLGIVSSIDAPTRQSFVVEMVGKDDLPNAVALNSTTFNGARIVGPAIAGLMIGAVGTGWAFLANALSSVAVLAGLYLMRPAELFPAPPVARERGQFREGLRYVRSRNDLMLTMILVFVLNTFGFNFQVTSALIAKLVFHRTATGYGLLTTSLAVGALLGAAFSARRTARPTRLFLVAAATAFGVVEVAAGLMPSFGLTALTLAAAGLSMLVFSNATNAAVQMGVEPTMRGRIMALYMVCGNGGAPVGSLLAGWVADAFGARWSLIGGGLISAAAGVGLGLLISRRRGLDVGDLVRRVDHARPHMPHAVARPVVSHTRASARRGRSQAASESGSGRRAGRPLARPG